MNHFDFLSSTPIIYSLKEKRGKNKLGGFFSIVFVLTMIALITYYIYIYFFGLEYNLIYFKDLWYNYMNNEQKESLEQPKHFFLIIVDNPNNAKIKLYVMDYKSEITFLEKCNKTFERHKGDTYCFDLVFNRISDDKKIGNKSFVFFCEENCNNPNGEPSEMTVLLYTSNLKIDHTSEKPLQYDQFIGNYLTFKMFNKTSYEFHYNFNPIMYNSSEILNTKTKNYIETYYSSADVDIQEDDDFYFMFYAQINSECDIYIREYRTLLDTLSKIGGLFTPLKLLFEVLIMFYSDLEINSEITKNVFSKIKNYEYKQINKIQIEKNTNDKIIKPSNENKIFRKKFNINKSEQYFCSFFNFCCDCCYFCRNDRTMKILNLCSHFIKTYLSAENIIFNMLLFESYYKDNPIKVNINSYLDKIDKAIEKENIIEELKDKEENKEEKKEERESLIPSSSEEG